jgi:hypothetical protein
LYSFNCPLTGNRNNLQRLPAGEAYIPPALDTMPTLIPQVFITVQLFLIMPKLDDIGTTVNCVLCRFTCIPMVDWTFQPMDASFSLAQC